MFSRFAHLTRYIADAFGVSQMCQRTKSLRDIPAVAGANASASGGKISQNTNRCRASSFVEAVRLVLLT